MAGNDESAQARNEGGEVLCLAELNAKTNERARGEIYTNTLRGSSLTPPRPPMPIPAYPYASSWPCDHDCCISGMLVRLYSSPPTSPKSSGADNSECEWSDELECEWCRVCVGGECGCMCGLMCGLPKCAVPRCGEDEPGYMPMPTPPVVLLRGLVRREPTPFKRPGISGACGRRMPLCGCGRPALCGGEERRGGERELRPGEEVVEEDWAEERVREGGCGELKEVEGVEAPLDE